MVNGGTLPYEYRKSGPAVDIAIENIKSMYSEVFDVNYIYMDAGLKCSENGFGAIAADVYYNDNIDVFIGPGCSFGVDVIGRLSASWNLPVITPVGTNAVLEDKNNFPTLTRLSYNMNTISQMYLSIFSLYDWTDVTIISDVTKSFFRIVKDSLMEAFQFAGINVERMLFNTSKTYDIGYHLKQARLRSRVIVVSCSGDTFREFMLIAHQLGMTTGEYVFIIISLFDGDTYLGDFGWKRNDSYDKVETVLYRGQNDSIAKCSKCMELGHRASQCQNDWKCRNCGESRHKQIDCTKIDSAEGESIPHNNAEYNEDDTSYHPSHQSNSESDNNDDMNDGETQHPLGDVQPDDLFNCTIDQSQSILTNTTADKTKAASQKIDPPAARPKVFPARKSGPTNKHANPDHVKQSRNTGQSQMTQFMQVTNQESCSTKKNENKQVNTPGKSTSGRGIEKSPVTPTEQLHDGTRNNANKRSKTAS
ncbi:unnamed protein product [Mytilus edulis]|uniref:CCHC-type domain-containing protein n=1 Tax=Mytilus edulis TaxID=6550 RepID=A0A8S3VAW5_MYTED|nr:unnamed protein product [Mytilus edulis]